MRTEPESRQIVLGIFGALDSETGSLSIGQVLTELQVVIERISFSGLHSNEQNNYQVSPEDIDILFEGEISDSMLNFVHKLAERRMLRIVADRTGQLFLNFCIQQYKLVKEIRFLTPVLLSEEAQNNLLLRLRLLYPAPARIIFETNPSLVAGFVINDGTKTVDYSLKSTMVTKIKPHLYEVLRQQRQSQGASRG